MQLLALGCFSVALPLRGAVLLLPFLLLQYSAARGLEEIKIRFSEALGCLLAAGARQLS